MNLCPNGVMRMSDEVAGVTETSLNMGVISTKEDSIQVLCLIRSLIDSGRQQVESMLTSLAPVIWRCSEIQRCLSRLET